MPNSCSLLPGLVRGLAFFAPLFAALFSLPVAQAQYPQKTIRMIVPFAAAGPPDILGRLIAQKLGEQMGQSMIVENRAGAGGTIGARFVAEAAPDGYTLMLGSIASLLISPALYAKPGYDPINSFAPISVIGETSFALVVNPKLPAHSVKELSNLAKAQPGKINYGSSTLGTPPHLMAEMFKSQAGVDIFGINYKGSADAVTALLSGDVQVLVDQYAALLPLIGSGKVRPLMVMSAKRFKGLPDVPSAPEAGLPGLAVVSWFGVLGPKGLPADVVKRLHGEMVKAIGSKELTDMLGRQGLEPLTSTPEEYAAMIRTDAPKWAAAVKASGAKVE